MILHGMGFCPFIYYYYFITSLSSQQFFIVIFDDWFDEICLLIKLIYELYCSAMMMMNHLFVLNKVEEHWFNGSSYQLVSYESNTSFNISKPWFLTCSGLSKIWLNKTRKTWIVNTSDQKIDKVENSNGLGFLSLREINANRLNLLASYRVKQPLWTSYAVVTLNASLLDKLGILVR